MDTPVGHSSFSHCCLFQNIISRVSASINFLRTSKHKATSPMAAFSDQYHPFLLNGSSNINMSALTLPQERHYLLTQTDFSLFDPYVVQNQEPDFIKDSVSGTKVNAFNHDSEASINKRHCHHNEDSAVFDCKHQTGDGDRDSHKVSSMEKRRKRRRCSSLVPVKPKVATQGKNNRQKKSDGAMHGQKKQTKPEKKVSDQPPTGYIHVRARRGEATDSHSLAERVRREKISERMRILQRLVPGCDKLTGKALMLDEIINYVQSLQNQIEFLSMRIASLNPILYDFSMDLDPFMVGREKPDNLSTCRPNLHPSAFVNAPPDTTRTMSNTFTFTPDGNDHRFTPFSISRQFSGQGQRANFMGDQESAGRPYWDMEEQRQRYLNPCHDQEATYAMPNNGDY